MIGFTLCFCALVYLLFFAIFDNTPRPRSYPPGPKPFKYLGNFPHLLTSGFSNVMQRSMNLAKLYGPVYAFSFGQHAAVVISDYTTLKEVFQRPELSGRPKLEAFLFIHDNRIRGIGTQDGEHWRQLRMFIVKQLREYGKKSIENIIAEESQYLLQRLDQNCNEPISTKGLFNHSSVNILWRIITGERVSSDDKQANEIIQAVVSHAGGSIKLLISALFIDLAKRFPNISGYKQIVRSHKQLSGFIHNFIVSRKMTFVNEKTRKANLVDAFFEKLSSTKDPASVFFAQVGEENLKAVMYDLFLAGVETTSTTLCWLLLYLAVHPEKQESLQSEIDIVLEGRFPTLKDKPKMPYLESVIMETMRKSSVLPMGVFHSALQDTQIGGHCIPKDTIVAANVYAIHHDEDTWTDPGVFRPERFLSYNGGSYSYCKHEAAIPFSIGKRACPGESVARDTLFFFVSCIFQRFSITWNPKKSKPTLDAVATYVLAPNTHELIFTRR